MIKNIIKTTITFLFDEISQKMIAEDRNTSSDQNKILYRESSNQMEISGARIHDQ